MNRPHSATGAVLARERARLRADFWDLGMLTWIPLLLYALTWWIFAAGIARDVPIAVIDQDHSAISRQLVRWLDASPGMQVVAQPTTEAEAMRSLRERHAYGIVILPPHLETNLLNGKSATVEWFYNAQFSAHAGGLARDVRTVVSTLSAGVEINAREKRGASGLQATQQFEPIRARLVTLFNENVNYEPFLALALIPSLLQIFVVLAIVSAIGKEFRDSTVSHWLAAANGKWHAAVGGKLIIPALAYSVQGLLFLIFFAVVRGWSVTGSVPALVISLLLLVAAYLGVGLLLIGVTLSLRNSLSGAAFLTAPAFAFSGQSYPLSSMPTLAWLWAEALPLTHYLDLQSKHWLAGAPWRYGVTQMLTMAAFAIGCGGLGFVLLRWRGANPRAWGKR